MSANWLFVDMNSFFASVEQQVRPELRERPVAVLPMLAETTCCIAASYEAKAFGVKTGTMVREARFLCPDIIFVPASTKRYVDFHNRIVQAVESVLPVEKVYSIDEMACRLRGPDRQYDQALELGQALKQAIQTSVGECLLSSVGLAPNRLLAKVASNLHKPNGLSLIRKDELPDRLYPLELTDLPGIGSRMLRRFHRVGVRTIEQLYRRSQADLHNIWGGVSGDRWYHLLRGEDLPELPTQRRTVGHSHVLAPEFRTAQGAYSILVKLTHKAGTRLRKINYTANRITIEVNFQNHSTWSESVRIGDLQDTQSMLDIISQIWERCPTVGVPKKVAITLSGLKSAQSSPLPLFPEQQRRLNVARTMDKINERLGDGALYFGAMHASRKSASNRIAFQSIPDCQPVHPSAQKK